MTTLFEFLSTPRHDGKNVAGYLFGASKPQEFRYFSSDRLVLPAFVNALQAAKNKDIFTNLASKPWISNLLPEVKALSYLKSTEGPGATPIAAVEQTQLSWPSRIVSPGAGAAPLDGGGLHASALGIKNGAGAAPAGSRALGLQRALRYYMLAAYAIVDISGQEAFNGLKHYIGSLLVADNGQILAAGIHTGSYRHAEVSTLISYFRDNSTAAGLPTRAILFSTLTPCKQCTTYLQSTMAHDTVIYFGQPDTGKFGRAGKAISSQLSEKTKPLMGRVKAPPTPDVGPSETDLGVVVPSTASGVRKIEIDTSLTSVMVAKKSIGEQLGSAQDSRDILRSASDALIHKALKDRKSDNDEEAVKQAVLQYVTGWLGRAILA